MKIYFIRHAHAESRAEWEDDDFYRPLTDKGITRADEAFGRFVKLYDPPDVIVTSEAVRAEQTADILKKYCSCKVTKDPLLNPGADILDYESVIKTYDYEPEQRVAVVGHEPDMTKFISFYVSEGELFLIMKKGSICYVDNKVLKGLIQQKYLLGDKVLC